ncbi:TfuA-like protein [Actinoplanes regularis]|uniref:TfuA-like core domain-containing protein n=1 Tax=Actinoplanes regularis TaxID=52697 RepID=A0A239HDT2_9ACTN|nr:TfuA-like protein [Actinoplanes regularis]GIE91016.1 hypothetical protein Are01nite_74960 [Actinoplanes regularis]SNS79596.1 hypothetical protein SAMN06264365_12455 [Actinoplanes regularis]
MSDYVFLGPSLDAAEAVDLLPGAIVRPPIEHGDLLRLDPGPGDRVFIVDGLFMLRAPVRHREILHYLDRGVVVAGSSSMGALRAAELWQYGMRGAGTVFELYRDGVVTDDDEVAVVHAPAEEDHRSMSEPLVNLRVALDRAARAGVLTTGEASRLLETGRALPFRARGRRALQRAAKGGPAGDSFERFAAWDAAHPTDVKAEDARLLLRLAAAGDRALRPRDAADTPIENVDTYIMEAWTARAHGRTAGGALVSDAVTVATIMVLHPEFPARHAERVLADLVGAERDADPERVRQRAVTLAQERGLLPVDDPAAIYDSPLLTASDRDRSPADAALRVLIRMFGPVDCGTLAVRNLPAALRTPEVIEAARSFAGSAMRLNDRLPHPDPHRPHLRMTFRDEVVDRLLCRLWDCPPQELPAAVRDHGFVHLDRVRALLEPLTAGLKVCGPPAFPGAAAVSAPLVQLVSA